MAFSKQLQNRVGQEYMRRKFYRIVALWITDRLQDYNNDSLREKILKDESIIDELEDDFHTIITKNQILANLHYVELYKNSVTENDIMNIAKKIKFQLFDYKNELDKNPLWLPKLCQDCLLRFLSYVESIKNEPH